jgi:hypothetical protein
MSRSFAALLLSGCLVPAAAADCLPDGSGYLVARLRGDLDADLDWRGPALACSGMPRPDGHGLRVHFSGTLPDGRPLAFVFAPPRLAEGEDARAVPVNVTILQQERIYGTRGDGRCLLDQVLQQPLADESAGAREWVVEARGFCTEPARPLGDGRGVLLTRFDFRGRVSYPDESADPGAGPPADPPAESPGS